MPNRQHFGQGLDKNKETYNKDHHKWCKDHHMIIIISNNYYYLLQTQF